MGTVKYSGPVASFHCPTNAEIRSLKVHFSPKQEGSGDPSPENVRPIVGWDGVVVHNDDGIVIPEEYQKVEYIEANGTQYIDINNTAKAYDIEICAMFTQTRSNLAMLTGYFLWSDAESRAIYYTGNYIGVSRRTSKSTENDAIIPTSDGLNKKLLFELNGSLARVTDVNSNTVLSVNTNNVQSFPSCPLWLFHGASNGGYSTRYASARLYYAKYYLNNELVCNLYPCKRISDSKPGMYDTVTQTFFTNQGTGEFLCGPDVVGETTAVDWSEDIGTIYGGWVDLVTGEISQTFDRFILTGEERIRVNSWKEGTFDIQTFNTASSHPFRFLSSTASNTYCNILKPQSMTYFLEAEGKMCLGGGTSETLFSYVIWKDTTTFGTTIETCKAKLQELYNNDTPFEFYAELQPRDYKTYYLAPTQLQTFLGQNNVWSNADYVEVEYDLHETQTLLQRKAFIMANQPHIESASGAIASFNTDLRAPLKECKVHFSPVQGGSGDPSPDNVRPISGWTGINVTISPTQQVTEGQTLALDWTVEAGTIYGGELDLLTGILTSTYAYIKGGWTLMGTSSAGYNSYLNSNNPLGKYNNNGGGYALSNMISQFDSYSSSTVDKNIIQLPTYGTGNAFMALDQNLDPDDVEVVYVMNTPITYQLTPTQLKTLRGINNIWSNAGETKISYWKH